ncbi:hypothetical protein CALVIDRAFT_554136 [Calocera viscosa TUFC12733]|uniref:Pre-rRNA-processing protein RIX1 N-terminal domain-containing protein n=1 Tax=Calocera viscosa (strain TUFC12733) TaxID=1330018 RepID=A0A167NTS0_CALVF|nr:hypothetical protein CALVIDRAFT_554136 [Calocera viscosa TUFC12733]
MASPHPLAALLQHYIATDDAAATYLPSTLATLTPQAFQSSSHLAKWTARVNSLIASKNRGGKWAGVCLAARTAECSKDVMVNSAAGWVGNVLPILQKAEPVHTQSAAVSLLDLIFSKATDMPEFARQVCTPTVPKFSLALIALCDGDKAPLDLKVLCLRTLSHMLHLYPNAHRSLQTSLNNLCMANLKGASPTPTQGDLRRASATLFAMVSVTGGKVSAADTWKKNMLGALRAASDCVKVLRATSTPPDATPLLDHVEILPFPPFPEDPLDAIPIALDRLRCMTSAVEALFRFPASRPVPVPIGAIMQLCTMMLQLREDEAKEPFDSAQRVAELAALREVWRLGGEVLSLTARLTLLHMSPYGSRLLSLLVRQAERNQNQQSCITFLRCIHTLLASCIMPTERQSTDLLKLLLPLLSLTLPSATAGEKTEPKKNSKKRSRPGYEGDEVFRKHEEWIDVQQIAEVSQIVALLLKNPKTPLSFRALAIRHLVNILLHLDDLRISDPDKAAVWKAVWSALEVEWLEHGGAGGVAVNLAVNSIKSEAALRASQGVTERLERLMHPRLPPLLRNIPIIEILGLQIPDGEEERALASKLGIDLSIDPASEISPAIRASGKPPPDMTESAPVVLPQQMSPHASAEPGPSQPLFMQHREMQSPPPASAARFGEGTRMDAMDVDVTPHHSIAPPASYGTHSMATAESSNSRNAPPPSVVSASTPTVMSTAPEASVVGAPKSLRLREDEEITVTTTVVDKGKQKETLSTTSTFTATFPVEDDDDEPMPTLDLESDTDEDEEDEDDQ